jgi:putative addiction module CopG family antidote
MSMTLSPELEELVRAEVETGLYRDADDVMRRALQSLRGDPVAREAALKAAIRRGLEDLEAGRYTVINNKDELEAFFRDL